MSKWINPKRMLTIGEQIRKLREKNGLPLRKVAAHLDIDQSVLSKIERGERQAARRHIIDIAKLFNVDERDLLINYLSEKVLYDLQDEELANDAIKMAEMKIDYLRKLQDEK